jgi:hypothetical protein
MFLVSSPAGAETDGALEPLPAERARVEAEVADLVEAVAAARGRPWRRPVGVAFAAARPGRERVSGFYTWGSDTVTLVDRRGLVRRPLLAHELAHALQDQHDDLRAISRRARERGADADLALDAAVEGEAHAVAAAVLVRDAGLDRLLPPERWPPPRLLALLGYRAAHALGLKPAPTSGEPPPVERDRFLAPYIEGIAFVREVVRARGGGLRALDGVLSDPPASSEQALHPEKYLASRRDAPRDVAAPPPPGEGWRLVSSNTVGEWGLRAELSERLPRAEARRAAAGWGGDRRAVYAKPGERRVRVTSTVWDTEGDAREFAIAARAAARAAGRAADVEVEEGPGAAVVVRERFPERRPAAAQPRPRRARLF